MKQFALSADDKEK